MRQKHLPPEGLFKDENDEDDEFTLRRKEELAPSSELKDELTATILRIAKERFSKRKPPQIVQPSIEVSASPRIGMDGDDASSNDEDSDASSDPPAEQATNVNIIDDEDGDPSGKQPQDKTYDPVVSADDELSASLLKPSVRHILAQLDKTLTILHNTRVAGLSYLSDSSETETEDESDNNTPSRKRGRGRPRLPPQPAASPGASTSRRGRPKLVHLPETGETKEQMALRLARRYHRRLPATEQDREAAFEEWLRQGDERVSREQRMMSSRPASEEAESQNGDDRDHLGADDDEEGRTNVERKIRRWGLRDWSDIVGAAALAGFPPDVIQRTTQRCANLFGQGMTLSRLDEVPAARAAAGARSTVYRPERIRFSESASESSDDADDENQHEASLRQRRIASRQNSLALPSREVSVETPRRGRHGREPSSLDPTGSLPPSSPHQASSRSQSRSRSRSRSRSSAGILYCPIASCDRAATGFARATNMRRHMRLVHPGHDEDAVAVEDSEDETLGAVHVDGFLRTINPGRGWRGADSRKRRRDVRLSTPPPRGSPRKRVDVASSGESE